ncbi:hypothetical protein PsYK624_173250 [Phanerochaete sordida]|uniref:Uncharacterized protein n=1 Tax=Phanerochaete sordida TaxID=48140 RepID=A0A9P3GTF3_9APHY|nr:hypothetical protein PsYK624_173250 [Phanerochaete sordida]
MSLGRREDAGRGLQTVPKNWPRRAEWESRSELDVCPRVRVMINLCPRATHLHLHRYANASSSRIRAISPHTKTGCHGMKTLLRRRFPSP